jgi:hypothetical protein
MYHNIKRVNAFSSGSHKHDDSFKPEICLRLDTNNIRHGNMDDMTGSKVAGGGIEGAIARSGDSHPFESLILT